jgi:hypothetical protein
MTERIVKVILRADGRRRVVVSEHQDGTFRFCEQARYDIPLTVSQGSKGERWAPLGAFATICDTADAAEQEARTTVLWLVNPREPT